MKSIYFLILIAIGLSLACGATTLSEITTSEPQALPTETPAQLPQSPIKTPLADDHNSPLATPALANNSSPLATPALAPADMLAALPPEAATLAAKAEEMLTRTPPGLAAPGEVVLAMAEAKQWPDSSLDCPRDGMMYNQVITPGYLFIFQAGNNQYEFHTDTGETVVLCFINGQDASEALPQ